MDIIPKLKTENRDITVHIDIL